MRITFGLLAALLLIAACGQKGPLYLPEQKPRAAASAAVTTPDTQSDNKRTLPTK